MFNKNVETIKSILATNDSAVEAAVVRLHNMHSGRSAWDRKGFAYYARWINAGKHLSGDFLTKARVLTIQYAEELLAIAVSGAKVKEDRGVLAQEFIGLMKLGEQPILGGL